MSIIFLSDLNKIMNKRVLLSGSECDCNNRGECISNENLLVCKCEYGFYGRRCELISELYTILSQFSDMLIFSIQNLIQNDAQIPIDSALEAFGIISTISAAALTNNARDSMLSSISALIMRYGFDELDLEHIYFIIRYAINFIDEGIIYDALLKSAFNRNAYTRQISLIESIFAALLTKKVEYKYFVSQPENVALGNLKLAYHVSTATSTLSANISFKLKQSTLYAIEYPYEISRAFDAPYGYSIGSNAIGISLISSHDEVNIITAFDPYVINSLEKSDRTSKLLLYNWDISCGCYNGVARKFDKSVCEKVVESDGMLSCSCISGYTPCYLVYKFPAWKIVSIALPMIFAIALVIVVLILLRRKLMKGHAAKKDSHDKIETSRL
jgi:hypothetical protein